MKISLENQVVVVTGGARRLGRAIALECVASGASVAITYCTSAQEAQEALRVTEAVRVSPAQKIALFRCDLTHISEIVQLAEDISATMGTPTALVNNAAIFRRTPFRETDLDAWEQAFDEHIATNLKAPYMLCKIFGDLFLKQQRGAIVNLADIYGTRPLANYTPYCLSKAGLVMLTQSLAKALAPHVRVNAIAPGTILPPSEHQNEADDVATLLKRIPLERLGTAEEIAQTAAFLIGGPQFISGAILPVDGAQSLR